MGVLSARELAAMRAEANRWLADTCTIQAVTVGRDTVGGITETWANTATSVPCRLVSHVNRAPAGGTQGEQYQVRTDWILHLAYDQAIATGQRVTVGADTYEVQAVDDEQTERASRRAWLKRVD